ncbi:MAG: insulinase family protein [Alphaproteobacteria bacterium]|nr:insulinase family protein [Alphaproteobacteria bacterium]MCL2890094.1 insulinase family protein [Alphaproteobacteria bacterium]
MLQPKYYTLTNGLPVIIDSLPGFESVTIGVYIKNGSRNESDPRLFGISHLLEHMAFKGTTTRDAREITMSIENIGGAINAYTSHNSTAYFATVPVQHKNLAMDILSDILLHPTFPEAELEKEKCVIAQEIKMYQDMPDAILEMNANNSIFRGGMQHDIAGTIDSVTGITRDDLIKYFHAHYTSKKSVIVISGGQLEDTESILADLEIRSKEWRGEPAPAYEHSTYVTALSHTSKPDLSHSYFKIIWPTQASKCCCNLNDFRMFLFAFGAGWGSRLFQEIREKLALAYSIGAYSTAFEDIGIATVEGQTDEKNLDAAIRAVAELCKEIRLKKAPISDAEISRAKEMIKGGIVMGLESTGRRADFFASRYMLYGKLDNMKDFMRKIDMLPNERINECARKMLSCAPSIITLGTQKELPLAEWQNLFSAQPHSEPHGGCYFCD